ncbi:hypothetical protein CC2G_000134 [Coprinopsis cinerea AmutBmut pab1-1]|nr:hypothetical protein CC2G_000134 [Coprinopsis cinerea AmutBmut pab1-1]
MYRGNALTRICTALGCSPYNLLSTNEDDEGLIDSKRAAPPPTPPPAVSRGVVIALVAFVLIDVLAYLYIAKALLLLPLPGLSTTTEMEFRDPYFGLDDLYRTGTVKSSQYPKLLNIPRVAAQVSRVEKDKVAQIDAHRWLSDFGLLSPPDRRLQVSSTVRTIVQFNVMDYGMEKCSMVVRLPSRDEQLPHPFSYQSNDPSDRDSIHLDICQLDQKRPLDEHRLSWSTKPRCMHHVGTLKARVGEQVELPPFECRRGQFLAYEVSCAQGSIMGECGVDVWSNQNQTWGLFMYQHQTVF